MKAMTADGTFVALLRERWGRYAPPEAEAQPITFEQYVAWTPEECNKMELVEGRPLIGGQDDGVERMLAFLMRTFGLAHVLRLGSADLWREALLPLEVTVPAGGWTPLPEPSPVTVQNHTLGRRQAGSWLATLTRLQVDRRWSEGTWLSGPFAVRTDGNTVLIPDALYVSPEHRHRLQEYHLENAPDWVLEAPWPPGMSFCRRRKVPLYIKGGAREVWVLDWAARSLEIYGSSKGQPLLLGRYGPGDTIRSALFDELAFDMGALVDREFPVPTRSKGDRVARRGRRARPELAPCTMDWEDFRAWKPREYHKLEIVAGRVTVGGLVEEAERTLAFLLRAVGLLGAIQLAPAENWRDAVHKVNVEKQQ